MFFLLILPIVAALAGRAAALGVLTIGLINGALLLAPTGSLMVAYAADRITMFAYAGVGAALTFLGARLMTMKRRVEEAERRLNMAQENTGVAVFDIDLRTRTIIVSPALLTLFGRQQRNGQGSDTMPLDEWNSYASAEELQEARAMLRERLAQGVDLYEREHPVALVNGQERWFHSTVHIERDAGGRAIRLRGASVDITERKRTTALLAQAQNSLTQQVADLQRLQALSGSVIKSEDLHTQLRLILQSLMEFNGAQKGLVSLFDPVAGQLAVELEIGFGRHLQQLAPLVEGRLTCGRASSEKRRIVVADIAADPAFSPHREYADELGFRAAHCTPLVNASGAVNGVISLYFPQPHAPDDRELRLADLCADKANLFVERAHARVAEQQSEQRFRLALDSSAVPFNVFSPVRDVDGHPIDFRWIYANHATGRILKTDAAQLGGRTLCEVLDGEWDKSEMFSQLSAVAELGITREFELYLKVGPIDGWYRVIASPMQGAVAAWFADVTARRRDEEVLRNADRRKDAFLATLAHELRNPLAPIRQAIMIAKSAGATETQKRWSSDVIERQVQHMALLLDDLLDVSRITRGTLQLRKSQVALTDIVNAAVETGRPLIEARAHRLLIDIPPEVRFEGDPLRVSQIVSNLLTNAAKYTDAGGTIRLGAERAGNELCISVTDNGVGILPAALDEVFEMFTQIRSHRDRSGGGLGIGLALSRGLAELHGGVLEARSEGPGMGSRFTLRLPLGTVTPFVPEQPTAQAASVRARRILVADDNRDAAETLAEFLRLEGHEVHVAYDGLAALAEFSACTPEVALLDIGMPGLTGNEVAQRARRREVGRHAMLIAVTGWGQEKDRAQALAAGFNHHLTKPVDLGRLRQLLEKLAA